MQAQSLTFTVGVPGSSSFCNRVNLIATVPALKQVTETVVIDTTFQRQIHRSKKVTAIETTQEIVPFLFAQLLQYFNPQPGY